MFDTRRIEQFQEDLFLKDEKGKLIPNSTHSYNSYVIKLAVTVSQTRGYIAYVAQEYVEGKPTNRSTILTEPELQGVRARQAEREREEIIRKCNTIIQQKRPKIQRFRNPSAQMKMTNHNQQLQQDYKNLVAANNTSSNLPPIKPQTRKFDF